MPPLSGIPLEELDDFLTLEGVAAALSSVAALALVPQAPSNDGWLPNGWGDGRDDPAAFGSTRQEGRLRTLVLQLSDDIVATLVKPGRMSVPPARTRHPGGSPPMESKDRCRKFLRGERLEGGEPKPSQRADLPRPTGHAAVAKACRMPLHPGQADHRAASAWPQPRHAANTWCLQPSAGFLGHA